MLEVRTDTTATTMIVLGDAPQKQTFKTLAASVSTDKEIITRNAEFVRIAEYCLETTGHKLLSLFESNSGSSVPEIPWNTGIRFLC